MQTLFSNPWKPLLEDIASLMISGIFGMDQTGNVTLNYDEEKITIRKNSHCGLLYLSETVFIKTILVNLAGIKNNALILINCFFLIKKYS